MLMLVQGEEVDINTHPGGYHKGLQGSAGNDEMPAEVEELAKDSSRAEDQQSASPADAWQGNGTAAVADEGDAKEKLRQMLEAQKAQDPNFAKLTGTSQIALAFRDTCIKCMLVENMIQIPRLLLVSRNPLLNFFVLAPDIHQHRILQVEASNSQ